MFSDWKCGAVASQVRFPIFAKDTTPSLYNLGQGAFVGNHIHPPWSLMVFIMEISGCSLYTPNGTRRAQPPRAIRLQALPLHSAGTTSVHRDQSIPFLQYLGCWKAWFRVFNLCILVAHGVLLRRGWHYFTRDVCT